MSASAEEDDARVVDIARHAVEWRVTIYSGRHGMLSYPAASLVHARAGGALLEQRLNNCRQSAVYAVSADGQGVFVSRRLDARILQQ